MVKLNVLAARTPGTRDSGDARRLLSRVERASSLGRSRRRLRRAFRLRLVSLCVEDRIGGLDGLIDRRLRRRLRRR